MSSPKKFGYYDTITNSENIDDRVDEWHDSPNDNGELHEHLGMSIEQYASYVETGKIPCMHTEGYWIQEGHSFRCYGCQYQFQLASLPNIPREIEVWEGS